MTTASYDALSYPTRAFVITLNACRFYRLPFLDIVDGKASGAG
ncbi:hypothetical protein ACQPZF_05650 [Actinosynnema sp. CS-041913]